MARNPCSKDCPERNGECHCQCDRYIEFKKQLEEEKKKKAEQNMINNTRAFLVDNRMKSLKKKQMKRGKK